MQLAVLLLPLDASFLMKLGCDGVFVGSGIFKSEDPSLRAKAVVLATTGSDNEKEVLEAQKMVDEKKSLIGLDTKNLELRMQERGPWVEPHLKSRYPSIQGDIEENSNAIKESFEELEIEGLIIYMKDLHDLDEIDGLIIPGGESTVIRYALILARGSTKFNQKKGTKRACQY